MTQKTSESTARELDPVLLKVALWFAGLSLRERITAAWAIAHRFMAKGDAVLAGKWANWAMEMERELRERQEKGRSGSEQQQATGPNEGQSDQNEG